MIVDLAQRLNRLREEGNLTVSDLARFFEVGRPSINSWFRGTVPYIGKHNAVNRGLIFLEGCLGRNNQLPIKLGAGTKLRLYVIEELKRLSNAQVSKPRATKKRNKMRIHDNAE